MNERVGESLQSAFPFAAHQFQVMLTPGEVFYLPPEAHEPEGKGHRPHVLLSVHDSVSDVSTLAYGSTKPHDAARGAEHVRIDPLGNAYAGTGLLYPTYVYPSRLVSAPTGALGSPAGRVIDEMPAIRASLARALGLGTGVTQERNVPRSNRRGRLIESSWEVVRDWDIRHALVITEPRYSRHGYHQAVIPLLDDTFEQRELDVMISDATWLRRLASTYQGGILAVPMISTLYLPDHITRFLDIVVPAAVMALVERALSAHFGLGTPGTVDFNHSHEAS